MWEDSRAEILEGWASFSCQKKSEGVDIILWIMHKLNNSVIISSFKDRDMREQHFTESLKKLFKDKNPPFLFVGSGFSIRYLNFQNFDELLKSLCSPHLKDFTYYKMKADGILPYAAQLMAIDFGEAVYSSPLLKEFKEEHKNFFIKKDSAFKYFVADYVKSKTSMINDAVRIDEINKLRESKIDAIITTNYDNFLESIFPDYRVFTGQSDLISSNPQMIGEIYKIHGCVSKPASIVITKDDYDVFAEQNKYLAAKLVTAFMERPIVFIGYSLNDAHIQNIIFDVACCLGEHIEKIKENIIFIVRANGEENVIEGSTLAIGKLSIPYTKIRTDNFGTVYDAMTKNQRKISAHLLRFFREQLYNIAITNEPTVKIQALLDDETELKDDVEFVVGYGLISNGSTTERMIQKVDILKYVVDEYKIDFLENTLRDYLPLYLSRSKFIPIYKFFKDSSINSEVELEKFGCQIEKYRKALSVSFEDYQPSSRDFYKKSFSRLKIKTFSDILENEKELSKILNYATLLPKETIVSEQSEIKKFLINLLDDYENKPSDIKSYFHKFICYYDRVLYGWN